MTRVFVLGQPDNARRIARILDAEAIGIRAAFVEPRSYMKLLAAVRRPEPTILMRVGYRIGASTSRGRVFDAYWSLLRQTAPRAVPCHYWLGTDVMDTVREARAGTLRSGAWASARDDLHLSVAPWLTSELQSVDLDPVTALLPAPDPVPAAIPPLPREFAVLTYLPAIRFEFYGGETILDAAGRMPQVRFHVVGGPGDPPRPPSGNVVWHGWVGTMAERYAETTVVVRIPEHDGFGNTVIEGLLYGRHVVYTQEVPFVRRAWPPTPDALVAAIGEFETRHAAGQLALNLDGRAYALDAFDEARLVRELAAHLEARLRASQA
jgi:hypothetical protein